jgi:hypothetical protein
VIVAELDVERIADFEAEANPPLIVDRDRVLSRAVSFERVQSIARRDAQVDHGRSDVNSLKLPQGPARHIRRYALRLAGPKQCFRLAIREGLDHSGV